MQKEFTPIIVGVSQFTQPKNDAAPLHPVGLMKAASLAAIDDAGAQKIRSFIDTIRVVNIFSYTYADAARCLAQELGINPKYYYYSTIGGNTPQLYINKAAVDIAMGRSQATLITGAEAFYSLRRAKKGESELNWPDAALPLFFDGEDKEGCDNVELLYGMLAPVYSYALVENRLRYMAGRDIETHRKIMGSTLSELSRVAAKNPYAWSKEERSADEITIPTTANRLVGFPYTMRMCANPNVDQAAAVIVTSEEIAKSLQIPRENWIYPMGGATFNNVWNISRRPDLHTSPALRYAGETALQQAGLKINEIDAFDFYSCFPCAVEIARNELNVEFEDERPVSLTGGLAAFGGPGNNYSLHAVCSAVELLRKSLKRVILITALGWLNTKWSVGIYGKEKGKIPWNDRDDSPIQKKIDAAALPETVKIAKGLLRIESYTIVYDKSGIPHHMTVLGRLDDDRRAFAFMFGSEILKNYEKTCPIGKMGRVSHDEKIGFNLLEILDG